MTNGCAGAAIGARAWISDNRRPVILVVIPLPDLDSHLWSIHHGKENGSEEGDESKTCEGQDGARAGEKHDRDSGGNPPTTQGARRRNNSCLEPQKRRR